MEPKEGHKDRVRTSQGLLNNRIIEVDPTTYKILAPRGRIFVGDSALNYKNYKEEEKKDNEENKNKEEDEELQKGFSDSSRSTIEDLLGNKFLDDAALIELLSVSEPTYIKGKGRPKGSIKASTASRKQQAFKNSTRRLLSAFKLQEARILDAEQQQIG